jgi:pimeloyl-ACP methyl ester carboxylesterase
MPSRYCNTQGFCLYLLVATAAFFQCTPAIAAASMALQPCQLPELSRPVRCGVLELPENPDRPQGRQLAVSVAVVQAASGKSLADPIVLLMGGPGENAIGSAAYFARQFDSLLDERDLLLIDQRGTGRSTPLRCDLYSPAEAAASLQEFLPLAAVKRCSQQCRARADLSQYTYAHLARDIEAIRSALGYGQLNLYSASCGTRAALIYLRMFPHNVRTVYFGSIVPLDEAIPLPLAKAAQLAMDKTFAACAADAKCHSAFPESHRSRAAQSRSHGMERLSRRPV